jgi:hypothetical protein
VTIPQAKRLRGSERVRFLGANPAQAYLLRGDSTVRQKYPPAGSFGSTMGRGESHGMLVAPFLPGPGGGLVYVRWDDHRFGWIGVPSGMLERVPTQATGGYTYPAGAGYDWICKSCHDKCGVIPGEEYLSCVDDDDQVPCSCCGRLAKRCRR